jgi:hypothetical protein
MNLETFRPRLRFIRVIKMHINTGEIFSVDKGAEALIGRCREMSTDELNRLSIEEARIQAFNEANDLVDVDARYLITLTKKERQMLSPKPRDKRKNFMRNKLCLCKSGKKFKNCCWHKWDHKRD